MDRFVIRNESSDSGGCKEEEDKGKKDHPSAEEESENRKETPDLEIVKKPMQEQKLEEPVTPSEVGIPLNENSVKKMTEKAKVDPPTTQKAKRKYVKVTLKKQKPEAKIYETMMELIVDMNKFALDHPKEEFFNASLTLPGFENQNNVIKDRKRKRKTTISDDSNVTDTISSVKSESEDRVDQHPSYSRITSAGKIKKTKQRRGPPAIQDDVGKHETQKKKESKKKGSTVGIRERYQLCDGNSSTVQKTATGTLTVGAAPEVVSVSPNCPTEGASTMPNTTPATKELEERPPASRELDSQDEEDGIERRRIELERRIQKKKYSYQQKFNRWELSERKRAKEYEENRVKQKKLSEMNKENSAFE